MCMLGKLDQNAPKLGNTSPSPGRTRKRCCLKHNKLSTSAGTTNPELHQVRVRRCDGEKASASAYMNYIPLFHAVCCKFLSHRRTSPVSPLRQSGLVRCCIISRVTSCVFRHDESCFAVHAAPSMPLDRRATCTSSGGAVQLLRQSDTVGASGAAVGSLELSSCLVLQATHMLASAKTI